MRSLPVEITQSHIQIKIKILHTLHRHLGPAHVIIKLLKDTMQDTEIDTYITGG